ncbi:extracellular solute-binding protein [Demequina activiva]|uniref:Iron ABC transporter substrate-binding protein n=1 Tax=Demequina activiva TaxID=1582364 RepID=A0A919UJJ8_9MICO|nr:extracellular solute-binding protein [Demequina activiva]GIG53860.1 iron ABC transporter substrate-binding protein [Demequina activiva]
MRSTTVLTGIVVASLSLAACTSSGEADAEPTATAAAEPVSDGELVVYSGRSEDLVQPLIDDFQEASGVAVEVRYADTTELAALLQEEGDATPADVYFAQDAGALGAVAKAGLVATLPEDISSAVDAGHTSTDGSWVGVTGRARVFVIDSEQVDQASAPTTAAELTDPEWSGQVGIAPTNASFQSFVTALRVLEGEDAARAWLEDMVANDVQIYSNNTAILEAAQAGEIQVGLINHYYWYRLESELGTDAMRAQLVFPESGDAAGIVNVAGAALMAGAAEDADAIAFLEYLVSEDGQQYFVEATYEYPLVSGVEAPDGLPEIGSLTNTDLDLSDLDSLSETTALLAEVGLL